VDLQTILIVVTLLSIVMGGLAGLVKLWMTPIKTKQSDFEIRVNEKIRGVEGWIKKIEKNDGEANEKNDEEFGRLARTNVDHKNEIIEASRADKEEIMKMVNEFTNKFQLTHYTKEEVKEVILQHISLADADKIRKERHE